MKKNFSSKINYLIKFYLQKFIFLKYLMKNNKLALILGITSSSLTLAYLIHYLLYKKKNKRKSFPLLGKFKNLKIAKFEENNNVYFKNKQEFLEKLANFKKDGIENLQIVSDFDQTITKFFVNGKKCPSIFSLFALSDQISQKFINRYNELFEIYSKHEIDMKLTKEQRDFYVREWYNKGTENFLNENLTKNKILNILNNSKNIEIRYNFDKFFKYCYEKNLTFFVISGGIIFKHFNN